MGNQTREIKWIILMKKCYIVTSCCVVPYPHVIDLIVIVHSVISSYASHHIMYVADMIKNDDLSVTCLFFCAYVVNDGTLALNHVTQKKRQTPLIKNNKIMAFSEPPYCRCALFI